MRLIRLPPACHPDVNCVRFWLRSCCPERVVHAKGAGAHGVFEITHDISDLTCAALFNKVGKTAPITIRFSTVGGELGSADTARDPRGMYTFFRVVRVSC